jgi:cytochrome c peroxidase
MRSAVHAERRARVVWIAPALGMALLAGCAGDDIDQAPQRLNGGPPQAEPAPGSLRSVAVPLPDLSGVVRDREAAVLLGKALFWDQQVGSDGMACASCHFHAGADIRLTNQLSPGLLAGDTGFGAIAPASQLGKTGSGALAGPNYTLVAADFPFHRLANPLDRNSAIVISTNDVASSAGVYGRDFTGLATGSADDLCGPADASIFHAGALPARQVEPRNSPTTINAVFFFRNFWDGRANNVFNGVDPFGRRSIENDPRARILAHRGSSVALEEFDVRNASLASQAVGPPLSDLEMSCAGRTFPLLGRKMLGLAPLALQRVHAQDSVLGPYRHPGGQGLTVSYADLIEQAFEPAYWDAAGTWSIDGSGNLVADPGGFTHEELNFSLYFGLAIMLYEATLISDDTRFDRYVGCTSASCSEIVAPDPEALTSQEERGLELFLNEGKCINCHKGPEFSAAASHLQPENAEDGLVERMIMGDDEVALYDNGFYNIGVRPTAEDPGLGGTDPFGIPLSFTRQYLDMLRGLGVPDPSEVDPCTFEVPFSQDLLPGPCSVEPTTNAQIDQLRVAVDGAFKTPGLRNIGLTPPYFHNGGTATLAGVIDFYNRGGDRRGPSGNDTTGTGPLGQGGTGGSNLDPDITHLGLNASERAALVAFLLALTDERVACEEAPFDHPSLVLPSGHASSDLDADGLADDHVIELPEIGASGRQVENYDCIDNTGNLFQMSILGF